MARISIGLRARLLGLVLLAVLPAVGLTIYTSLHERARASESAENEALRVANLVTKDLNDRVLTARRELAALAVLPVIATGNLAQCSAFLSSALGDDSLYNTVSIADATGQIMCSTSPLAVGRDASSAPWYGRLVQTRQFTTGGYSFSSLSGTPGLVAASPIRNQAGDLTGVVVGVIGFRWMEGIYTSYKLPTGGTLTLVDAGGKIMAHYPDNATWVGQTPKEDISAIVTNEVAPGTVESRGIDDVQRLYGFSPMPFSEPGREAYIFAGYPTSVAFAPTNSILRYTLVGLGIAALFICAVAWFGRDLFVLQHMKKLVATAERLEQGDLGARTGVPHSGEEVGQLAKTMDRLAASLQEAREQRDAFEASLAVANGRLEKANEVLRENAADLERKNQDLEAFTYSVSHDLKEPLRAIEGFSTYMVTNYSAQVDQRGQDLLGRISKASVRMKELIDDLLAVSRAARPVGDGAEIIDTGGVVDEVLESLATVIQERGAKVEVHRLPMVSADRARVDQIFRNLISNGIKFNTSTEPRVEVGVTEETEAAVTFYVRDNGIGIAPQYHDKIFGLFQRLHTRDEFDGNGAGLAIVKRAAVALGGKITLESAENQGTTFFVTLPRAQSIAPVVERVAA